MWPRMLRFREETSRQEEFTRTKNVAKAEDPCELIGRRDEDVKGNDDPSDKEAPVQAKHAIDRMAKDQSDRTGDTTPRGTWPTKLSMPLPKLLSKFNRPPTDSSRKMVRGRTSSGDRAIIRRDRANKARLATTVSELKKESGRLPSQTVQNPRGNLSAVTLRSGKKLVVEPKELEEEECPTVPEEEQPEAEALARAPKRYVMDKDVWELFSKVEINIPLLEAIKQIPRYAKFLKELCTNRRRGIEDPSERAQPSTQAHNREPQVPDRELESRRPGPAQVPVREPAPRKPGPRLGVPSPRPGIAQATPRAPAEPPSQDCIAAEELMVQMKALGLKPSKVTYDAFIKAVSSRRRLKEMQMNKVYPCETSLASLSVSCSKALKLDLAKDLLDKVSGNVGVLPFNAFLAACVALDKPEIAVRVLSRMKKMEVQFDMQTYELLFSLFGLVNAPYEEGNMLSREEATKRIKAIELDMAKNGLQHSFTTMKNLLSALGAEGQKSELVQYLHVAEKLFEPMDSKRRATLHNIVLQSLVELKESSMAINIFKNMRRRGFLPDTATYSIMIECCSVTECFRSALQLLSLMLRDGYYPTTVTYTSLMKVVKDNEHFYEELNLLDRASTEECDPLQRSVGDAVMYNTVLLKARAKGRIDIIEFLLEKMHQDKIQPNPVTCSIVLDAYTNQGYINTALESLQVLSLRMISEDKEELQKHQPEIEELILSQSPEAESQILQHFDSDVNFATALLNLRCCSLIGFSTPWSPDETAWAKTLSANFKSAFGA
ncbi:unnamed protein product [Rhodiola kirilowii]